MEYCVYKHTTPNGKVYIGQTCQKPEQRWNNGKGYVECVYFYNAILKYGWENISHEVLYSNLTSDEANRLEAALIKHYNSNNHKFGYNLRSGGANSKLAPETKAKISEATRGENNPFYGKHHSEETKERLRKIHTGTHLSEEAKRKLSLTNTGSYSLERLRKMSIRMSGENNPFYGEHHTKEARAKISKAHKGKKLSSLHKEKISKATKGKNNPMYGKHRTDELKEKLRECHSKAVMCIETGEVFKSALEAQEQTGISNSSIGKCCMNKQQTAGKKHWQFYESEVI